MTLADLFKKAKDFLGQAGNTIQNDVFQPVQREVQQAPNQFNDLFQKVQNFGRQANNFVVGQGENIGDAGASVFTKGPAQAVMDAYPSLQRNVNAGTATYFPEELLKTTQIPQMLAKGSQILGEGLAYKTSPVVRQQFNAGNTNILPNVSNTTPLQMAGQTVNAGLNALMLGLGNETKAIEQPATKLSEYIASKFPAFERLTPGLQKSVIEFIKNVPQGYAYDVSSKLAEGNKVSDSLKPGMGTLMSGLFSGVPAATELEGAIRSDLKGKGEIIPAHRVLVGTEDTGFEGDLINQVKSAGFEPQVVHGGGKTEVYANIPEQKSNQTKNWFNQNKNIIPQNAGMSLKDVSGEGIAAKEKSILDAKSYLPVKKSNGKYGAMGSSSFDDTNYEKSLNKWHQYLTDHGIIKQSKIETPIQIPKESPLIQEARKYKSAEEFKAAIDANNADPKGGFYKLEYVNGKPTTVFDKAKFKDWQNAKNPVLNQFTPDGKIYTDAGGENFKTAEDIWNEAHQSQGITPNVSLEKPQPTVAGQETGVPLENQPPGQTAPDMTGNKLPPSDVSYNQDIAPNGDNVKQRGFLETLQNSDKATPEMKQATSELPQGYTPIPQKLSEANAQKFVDEVGVDKAHQSFIDNTPWSSDKTKVGDVLLNKYAESGDMSKFKEIASSYDDQARQAGQGNAAINGWSQMSPKAVLNVVDDAANKLGKPISDDFRTQLVNRVADIQKMAKNSPERLQATQALLQDIAKELPNSFMENFKAYRFQNMLSNPVTIGKIGYSGIFNTMVTHPVDMIAEATTQGAKRLMNSDYQRTVYYSNIPKWYKDVFIGIPDAWDAAVQGFKKGTIDKALSDGVSGETAVQMARNQNTSKYLSFFPKLHSFVYKYGQSIISGAEFARMMDNGATEVEAKAAASKLADKLTLRSKLGANDQAAIVRAVDSMGNMISRSADKPGIGWMQSWVAPFMKVSTNWTKLAVEHSPLALPDTAFNMLKGKAGAENAFAHAMVGSMVTGIGVSMSMKDNVTLAAPTDKTQSDLFYASGKKPYSVKVGNSWVPMQYFGPFGLSLMLPQAMKEALTGVNAPKDTFTKSEQAVSKVTKMIISTTPLPTISQFIDILNGTSGVNPATVAAGLAGQVIPLDTMQRYISGIVDPIYRKASSFTDRIESGIPGMSKNLPAYTTPTGQPETRNASNYIAPYGIGKQDNQYEPAYKNRQQVLNSNAIVNQANKDAQNGTIQNPNGGKQIADKIWQLPDNTFTYQLSDGSYAKAKTQDEAKLGQAKDKLLNSDQASMKVDGGYLRKSESGTNTTFMSDNDYAVKLNDSKLTSFKKNENIKGWIQTATNQITALHKQMDDPNTDELDKQLIQNKIDTLTAEAEKYLGYGGFTKPKKPKALPKALQLPQLKMSTPKKVSIKKVSTALPKPLNLKQVKSPVVKIAKPTYRQSVAPQMGKRLA